MYISRQKGGSQLLVGLRYRSSLVPCRSGTGKRVYSLQPAQFTREAKGYQPRNETKIVLIDGGTARTAYDRL